jgi:hypothetical protein
MKNVTHFIKCKTGYFKLVLAGKKKFEIRINDRDYHIGDVIILKESVDSIETGVQSGPLQIQYILYDYDCAGLKDGHCIINW